MHINDTRVPVELECRDNGFILSSLTGTGHKPLFNESWGPIGLENTMTGN